MRESRKRLEQIFEGEMAAIMEQIRQEHLLAEELIELEVAEKDFIIVMRSRLGWLVDISDVDCFMRVYYYGKMEEEKK